MYKNILIFCEDYFGTGHIKRALNIAGGILEQDDSANVYIMYGGKLIESINVCSKINFYQLTPMNANNELKLSEKKIRAAVAIRSKEIFNIINSFEHIDYLLVDMYPFTRFPLRSQYRLLMDLAKKFNPAIKIATYIRDVEEPLKISSQCVVLNEISKYIDKIFVCGELDKNDVFANLPYLRNLESLVEYTGFVVPNTECITPEQNRTLTKFVISVGAGRDGYEIQNEILKSILPFSKANKCQIDVFMSQYFSEEDKINLYSLYEEKNINFHPFSTAFHEYLNAADIHICMGGYNSVAESFQANTFPILIPRSLNKEQLNRALYLDGRGLASLIRRIDLNSCLLTEVIENVLDGYDYKNINFDLSGSQFIAKTILNDRLICLEDMLNNLCNQVWLLMSIISLKNPYEFITVWKSCVNFGARINWNEELLIKYLNCDNENEFFARSVILPLHAFGDSLELFSKSPTSYDNAMPFSLQIFEQAYLLRKNAKSNFNVIIENMKKTMTYESFRIMNEVYDLV